MVAEDDAQFREMLRINELLGRALEKKEAGDWQGVIADCDEIIKIDKEIPDAWGFRGAAKHALNRSEEALADLDEAIKIDEKKLDAWVGRGVVNNQLGKYDEAEEDMNKALELSPNDPDIPKILAIIKGKKERQAKIKGSLSRLIISACIILGLMWIVISAF